MIGLAISVLWLLIGLCVLVGIGWVAIWVLNQLGIIIPPMVTKLALIVLGLLVLIYFLGLLASGSVQFPGALGGNHRLSFESSEGLPLVIAGNNAQSMMLSRGAI